MKRSLILKNIIRSAYNIPLQFTDISTVTGQTGLSGGFASSIPFTKPSLTGSITPTGSLSGNSTFGVTNLNTQEFYNGIQTPISKQLIALYLRSGFPARTLLPLVISEIEVRYKGGRARLLNSASNELAFRNFNSALQVLVAKGLRTQDVSSSEAVGPILSTVQAQDARIQAQLIASGPDAPTLKKVAGGYQLQKASKAAEFCFDPLIFGGGQPYAAAGVFVGSNHPRESVVRVPLVTSNTSDLGPATVLIGASAFCGSNKPKPEDDHAAKSKVGLDITITTRSVEGVISYLGDIVRSEAGLADGRPTPLDLPSPDPSQFTLYQLFRAQERLPSLEDISTTVDGHSYAVAVDPSGHDDSSRVLQLLTDLLALQSSAKNLPSPSVISVIAQ